MEYMDLDRIIQASLVVYEYTVLVHGVGVPRSGLTYT
jgi:hypothetical protein